MQSQQVRILLVEPPPEEARERIAGFLGKLYPNKPSEAIEIVLTRSSAALTPWVDENRASRLLDAFEQLGATVALDYHITETAEQIIEEPRPRLRITPRLVVATLAGLLVLVAVVALLSYEEVPPAPAPTDFFADPVVDQGVGPYDNWTSFSRAYAPHYDKRIAHGLCLALTWRVESHSDAVCRYRESQLDAQTYRLQFRLAEGEQAQALEIDLHNTPASVVADIENAYQVVQPLLPDRSARERIEEVTLDLDSAALLMQAIDLERQVLAGDATPATMLQIAQLYSWLVFLGRDDFDQRAANRLAAAAVGALLIGGGGTLWQDRFSSAMVMLALGYPRAARGFLGTTQGQSSQQSLALLAYLDKNIELLQQLQSDADPLPAYLLARALQQSRLTRAATRQYEWLLELNPDSVPVLSLVMRRGSKSQQRLYANHLAAAVIADQIEIAETLDAGMATTLLSALNWFSRDFSPEAGFSTVLLERQESYLLGGATVDTGSRLMTSGELRQLFRNQLQTVLYTTVRVASSEHAEQAQEAAVRLYPGDPLVASMQVSAFGADLSKQLAPFVKSVSEYHLTSAAAAELLLQAVAERSADDDQLWPAVFKLLRTLRRTLNPNSGGCISWMRQLLAHRLQPLLFDYFDACQQGDPGNVELYALIGAADDNGQLIRSGGRFLGRNYGFVLTYAQWLSRHRPGEAKRIFRQAITIGATEPDAYRELGRLLAREGRGAAAIAIWREYLQRDDKTPVSFEMRTRIAEQLLTQGALDRAYAISQQLVGSTDAYELTVAARVAAANGETDNALTQFQRAARLNPVGEAPAELALFQLQRGDLQGAVETLKAHRAANQPYFYMPTLARGIKSAADLQHTMSLVRDVESSEPLLALQLRLARALALAGRYRNAARLLEKPAFDTDGLPPELVPIVGAEFIDYRLRAGTKSSPAPRLVRAYAKSSAELNTALGMELLRRGLAADSFRALAAGYTQQKENRDETLVLMASAWQQGRRSSSVRRQLRSRAERDQHDPWTRMRVGFLINRVSRNRITGVASTVERRCEVFYFFAIKALAKKETRATYQYALLSLATDQSQSAAFTLANSLIERSLLDD